MQHLTTSERRSVMNGSLQRKLGGFLARSEELDRAWEGLSDDIVSFAAGQVIVAQEAAYHAVYLVETGWVIRAKLMEDGSRQIVSVAVPGDFVALNALLFETSDFEHRCRTPVTAFRIDADKMLAALTKYPRLSSALFWVNAHEESILAERIVSLGRRTARARAAHVLCEFIARLEIIEEITFPSFAIPISQEDFADILGISQVHANRVLRSLERDGVLTFRNNLLFVHDLGKLQHLAGFDSGYLHFTKRTDAVGRPKLIMAG